MADASPPSRTELAVHRSDLVGHIAGCRDAGLPPTTVNRLPGYLRALAVLDERGVTTTASDELAEIAGVTPAQLRKDLSFLGSHGRRGIGYDVRHLADRIHTALGLATRRKVVIVGLGHLGHALAGYGGYPEAGFRLVGLFDTDEAVVGTEVAGLEVLGLERLEGVLEATGATTAVLCTPAAGAQDVVDRLVEAGVRGVLSFAPVRLAVPDGVVVRALDVGAELQILAFHEHCRDRGEER